MIEAFKALLLILGKSSSSASMGQMCKALDEEALNLSVLLYLFLALLCISPGGEMDKAGSCCSSSSAFAKSSLLLVCSWTLTCQCNMSGVGHVPVAGSGWVYLGMQLGTYTISVDIYGSKSQVGTSTQEHLTTALGLLSPLLLLAD